MALYEVYIEADEPWHDGLRQRVFDAVTTFGGPRLEDGLRPVGTRGEYDLDFHLAAYVPDYRGYGANAHPHADGFVFSTLPGAQAFAFHMRGHVGHEATVGLHSLADADDTRSENLRTSNN